MSYCLKIPTDGSGGLASDIVTNFLRGDSIDGKMMNPVEFEITPASGTIPPSCEVEIEVMTCGSVCTYHAMLMNYHRDHNQKMIIMEIISMKIRIIEIINVILGL